MERKTLIIIGALAAAAIAYYVWFRIETGRRLLFSYIESSVPTSPEVEYIEGQPDSHMVHLPDGGEMIRTGDIALSPGFGVGEGTFGFGRNGASFFV
jgi:hypothetical protein